MIVGKAIEDMIIVFSIGYEIQYCDLHFHEIE
jgi:hypothetical protein